MQRVEFYEMLILQIEINYMLNMFTLKKKEISKKLKNGQHAATSAKALRGRCKKIGVGDFKITLPAI